MTTVVQGWNHVMEKQFADTDYELTFDYMSLDTSSAGYYVSAMLRQTSTGGRVAVYFYPDRAELQEYVPGTGWVVRDTDTNVDTAEDEWYHVKAVCDGSSIVISRWQEGEMPVEIFDWTTTYLDTWRMMFITATSSNFAFDNVRILADDLNTTSTFTVNAADELVSMAVDTGGTTYYEYDAWGRMARKYMGTSGSPTFEATYEYKYDDKLVGVESDFPDEGDVSYTYGADGQRRSRTANGVITNYNWVGYSLLSEQNEQGDITATNVVGAGRIDGDDPSTGGYVYSVQDVLWTVRQLRNGTGDVVALHEFSPYGLPVEMTGNDDIVRFASHTLDPVTRVFGAALRTYDSHVCRWTTRDPSGMVDGPNVYAYATSNPATHFDPLGESILGYIGCQLIGHEKFGEDPVGLVNPTSPQAMGIEAWGFLKARMRQLKVKSLATVSGRSKGLLLPLRVVGRIAWPITIIMTIANHTQCSHHFDDVNYDPDMPYLY